jgi:hypothetical protein
VLALGRGFDPADPAQDVKLPCISFSAIPLDAGAPSTRADMTYVRNADQLNTAMHVDAKIDAAYLGAKVGGGFSIDTSNSFSSDSITVILTAITDFGRWGLDKTAGLTEFRESVAFGS